MLRNAVVSPFPDGNWLNIFKFNDAEGFVLAVIGVTGLLFSWLGWFHLDAFGDLGMALFACSFIIGIGLLSKPPYEEIKRQCSRKRREAEDLRNLDTLSPDSHKILSHVVSRNKTTFVAPIDCPKLASLVRSRLICRGPGGDENEKPHFVPPHVWRELRRRRNEFQACADNDALPWSEPRSRI
jgi:hypothetical protein